MPRQIIALEQDISEQGVNIKFRAAFWLTVAAARQFYYADAAFESAVRDGSVSAPELTALQNGSVVERVFSFLYPPGSGIAAIQADLVSKYAAEQADFTNQTGRYATTVITRYGTFYDGSTWTNKVN